MLERVSDRQRAADQLGYFEAYHNAPAGCDVWASCGSRPSLEQAWACNFASRTTPRISNATGSTHYTAGEAASAAAVAADRVVDSDSCSLNSAGSLTMIRQGSQGSQGCVVCAGVGHGSHYSINQSSTMHYTHMQQLSGSCWCHSSTPFACVSGCQVAAAGTVQQSRQTPPQYSIAAGNSSNSRQFWAPGRSPAPPPGQQQQQQQQQQHSASAGGPTWLDPAWLDSIIPENLPGSGAALDDAIMAAVAADCQGLLPDNFANDLASDSGCSAGAALGAAAAAGWAQQQSTFGTSHGGSAPGNNSISSCHVGNYGGQNMHQLYEQQCFGSVVPRPSLSPRVPPGSHIAAAGASAAAAAAPGVSGGFGMHTSNVAAACSDGWQLHCRQVSPGHGHITAHNSFVGNQAAPAFCTPQLYNQTTGSTATAAAAAAAPPLVLPPLPAEAGFVMTGSASREPKAAAAAAAAASPVPADEPDAAAAAAVAVSTKPAKCKSTTPEGSSHPARWNSNSKGKRRAAAAAAVSSQDFVSSGDSSSDDDYDDDDGAQQQQKRKQRRGGSVPIKKGSIQEKERNSNYQRARRKRQREELEQLKEQVACMSASRAQNKERIEALIGSQKELADRLKDLTAKWQSTVADNEALRQQNNQARQRVLQMQQQLGLQLPAALSSSPNIVPDNVD